MYRLASKVTRHHSVHADLRHGAENVIRVAYDHDEEQVSLKQSIPVIDIQAVFRILVGPPELPNPRCCPCIQVDKSRSERIQPLFGRQSKRLNAGPEPTKGQGIVGKLQEQILVKLDFAGAKDAWMRIQYATEQGGS
jgi:hypothetical protein